MYNNGDLKLKDNTLQFTAYDGEKRDIPIERISDIYVMSEMSFNTTFLNYISQYGIPIHFFNYYNYYSGSFYPKDGNPAGQLLVKQVEHYVDYDKRLDIAIKFIQAAADNIYRNLFLIFPSTPINSSIVLALQRVPRSESISLIYSETSFSRSL